MVIIHIPQVRSQNVVFLKYEFFRITNQSTRYRSLRHSGRDYWWNEFGWFVQATAWNSSPRNNQPRASAQINDSQWLRLYQCPTIFIWEVLLRDCNGTFIGRGNTTRIFERWTLRQSLRQTIWCRINGNFYPSPTINSRWIWSENEQLPLGLKFISCTTRT